MFVCPALWSPSIAGNGLPPGITAPVASFGIGMCGIAIWLNFISLPKALAIPYTMPRIGISNVLSPSIQIFAILIIPITIALNPFLTPSQHLLKYSPILPTKFLTLVRKPFGSAATADARLAHPANISPIPSGIPAPVSNRIIPRTIRAPPSIAIIVFTTLRVFSGSESHIVLYSAAIPTTPASSKPIPNGIFVPVKISIIPKVSNAEDTIAVITAILLLSVSLKPSQLAAHSAQSPKAPAAIIPSPNGTFTPANTKITPNARTAALTIAVILSSFACNSPESSPISEEETPEELLLAVSFEDPAVCKVSKLAVAFFAACAAFLVFFSVSFILSAIFCISAVLFPKARLKTF